ncbi:MAG: hypothetical protein K9K37_00715 [Desulfocapsa sp.]|nr:hypothetical protein [Desulfocapsa sp.]
MRRIIEISTSQRETLVDITTEVEHIVRESGITDGLIGLYAQGQPEP